MMKRSNVEYVQILSSFCEGDPNEIPWAKGKPTPEHIDVVPYDHEWPSAFEYHKRHIVHALQHNKDLNMQEVSVEHVGSTAVPGLAAKPVIDIDLVLQDSAREDLYVSALEAAGYELTVREPSWYEHRMLRLANPRVNLHVFSMGCPEHVRHVMFRDWLRAHPEDVQRYAEAKAQAAVGVSDVAAYNKNKNGVLKGIYDRLFAAVGDGSVAVNAYLK